MVALQSQLNPALLNSALGLGFLDGAEGFAYHFMQGLWYRCLVDLKCLEAERVLAGAKSKEEKIARLVKLTGLKLE